MFGCLLLLCFCSFFLFCPREWGGYRRDDFYDDLDVTQERIRSCMILFFSSLFRCVSGSGRNKISAVPGGLEILFLPSGCWPRSCGSTRTPSSCSSSRPDRSEFCFCDLQGVFGPETRERVLFRGFFFGLVAVSLFGVRVFFWFVLGCLLGFSRGGVFFLPCFCCSCVLHLLLHRTRASPVLRPQSIFLGSEENT